MEKKSQISAYEKEFPGWKIGKFLGRGSGGNTVVYEIYRENYDLSEHDALKVAKIMDDEIGMRKMTDEYREKYKSQRDEKKEKAMNEVRLMNMMQNCSNIVSYQDWKIAEIEEEDYTTVELLIRMHIYTDLDTIFKTHGVSVCDIVKIGIDICEALQQCHAKGIIHRDIKPSNIFYDDERYLLGDFGISRILENGELAQTNQGTKMYAAPEQFKRCETSGYGHLVDIYSLGLTLYGLANNGILPFQNRNQSDDVAMQMRVLGNQIEPIKNLDQELNRIILKACAYLPENRYQSSEEMEFDLKKFGKKIFPSNSKLIEKIAKTDFVTEHQMHYMKNYATDQAMRKAEVSDWDTESALKGDTKQQKGATTESALHAAGDSEYATESTLQQERTQEYTTESVMQAKQQDFATESVLQNVTERNYATESVLQKENFQNYATEPILGEMNFQNDTTEPALHVKEEKRKSETQKKQESGLQDPELGRALASIDTAEINEITSAESFGNVRSSEIPYEELRKKAVLEMKKGNYKQAFAYFATLAEKDDWESMYNEVTKLYREEATVAKRGEEAIFWLEKCVENCKDSWNISLIEFQLGNIYAKGIGVKKNHKIAEKYYRSSASKGNPYAKKKFVAGKYVK